MHPRIGLQIFAGVSLATVVTTGITAAVMLRSQRRELLVELTRSAHQLSETIVASTHDAMLQNRRDQVARQIELIGRQEGIERIRVFDRSGTIRFSSDRSEIGRSVDVRSEACAACHAGGPPSEHPPAAELSRVYAGGAGHRVLGVVHPFWNETSCSAAACHAHPGADRVLGILDVGVSLGGADREMGRSQRRMGGLAAGLVSITGLLLWGFNRWAIVEPVRALRAGTRRVADGDLTTTIRVGARNELGDLAQAFNDMTRRLSESRRQLAQADKLASIGRLAAGVAHEINNPLTGVLTYASFLLKRSEGNPALHDDLEVIVRETKRCREIIQGLLDFARPAPPRRQPTDLSEVARRALSVVMNRLKLDRVDLLLDLAGDLPPVAADPSQIEQVLVNLLVNAADAIGGKGGKIRLWTRASTLSPRGHTPVRQAICPKGCDLLDPAVRIGGFPAVRVLRADKKGEGVMHLDPLYGKARHQTPTPGQERETSSFLCPRCRTSLESAGRRCATCGAAAFGVLVPGDGRVEWCTRGGCPWTLWEAAEERGPRPIAEIGVEDSGRGIPPADLPHLFEPFFTTKGRGGTGLGLAVSWGIVDAHGGTIQVESPEGGGTRFTLALPAGGAKGAGEG